MKLAAAVWNYTETPEAMPKGDEFYRILDTIKMQGFEEVDFLATPAEIDEYYTDAEIDCLGKYIKDIGLVPNVMIYQAVDKWSDPDANINAHLFKQYTRLADVAEKMGFRIISNLAQRPYGATPWRLNPKACAQKEAFHLPDDYNYQEDFDRLVNSFKKCVKIAEDHGLKNAFEGHIWSMLSTPQAMLEIIRAIDSPNFGVQLDTNHLIAQRIDCEWTIHILGGKNIFNVHCKDHDMYSRGNIPAGTGICDYPEVIRALRAVGYDGNLTIELEFTDNPVRYTSQAKEHIEKCLRGEY